MTRPREPRRPRRDFQQPGRGADEKQGWQTAVAKTLTGAFLVVAATDDETVNAGIVTRATECGALVCDASSGERSKLIFGAVHRDEDGATVAVFTDGRDPAEARRTRDRIARLLDQERAREGRPGSA